MRILEYYVLLYPLKGLLVDRKADFALQTFTVYKKRAEAIDFMIINEAVMHGYYYIKKPRDTYGWIVFNKEAWIGLIVFSILSPLLIAIIAFFRKFLIMTYSMKEAIPIY